MSNREKDPSLRSVASDVAGAFWVRKNADLCREFIDYMTQEGVEYAKNNPPSASVSKAKNIFADHIRWMVRALRNGEPKGEVLPADPIEARIYKKRVEKSNRSLTATTVEFAPGELDAILSDETEIKAREKRENKKLFTSHICDLATQLSKEMMIGGKTLGVTALQHPPIIVEKYGFRGVLVQSFTVERNGDRFKCDFKANQRAVNISHPDIFETLDGNRLIRSNRGSEDYVKGAHEFYVKGVAYKEGMVFMRYLCANGQDQTDLATYYQIDNGAVVETTVERWKEVENLLAAGRNPSESLRPKSVVPDSNTTV
jgi:hypothetical protein